jgi:general secretion pathway protein K
MEKTSLSAARAVNVNARSEALWRAFATETLARKAIKMAFATSEGKMSIDDPWVSEPLNIPLDDGAAQIFFIDAGLCFNVNSLASDDGNEVSPSVEEFVRLAGHLGLSEFEAIALGEAIADWIDGDRNRRPQGAEDEYYTTLPSPYRTGNRPMAAASEIRAVKGVNREIYALLKPYLCAGEAGAPSVLNVNMLTEFHAPLLAALLGENATMQAATDIIAARPVGGYNDKTIFISESLVQAANPSENLESRISVTSRRFHARAEIVYDTAILQMTSDIAVNDSGETRVITRRIGAEE